MHLRGHERLNGADAAEQRALQQVRGKVKLGVGVMAGVGVRVVRLRVGAGVRS